MFSRISRFSIGDILSRYRLGLDPNLLVSSRTSRSRYFRGPLYRVTSAHRDMGTENVFYPTISRKINSRGWIFHAIRRKACNFPFDGKFSSGYFSFRVGSTWTTREGRKRDAHCGKVFPRFLFLRDRYLVPVNRFEIFTPWRVLRLSAGGKGHRREQRR